MSNEGSEQHPSVRLVNVEIVDTRGPGAIGGEVILRHHGKCGYTECIIKVAQLERWALRQMRELVFEAA